MMKDQQSLQLTKAEQSRGTDPHVGLFFGQFHVLDDSIIDPTQDISSLYNIRTIMNSLIGKIKNSTVLTLNRTKNQPSPMIMTV